jgi:hypothetical protein
VLAGEHLGAAFVAVSRLFFDFELILFPGFEAALQFQDRVTAGGEAQAGVGGDGTGARREPSVRLQNTYKITIGPAE